MDTKTRMIYEDAVNLFGVDNQINQSVEEMAELIKELNKFRRNCDYSQLENENNSFRGNVIAEIADVRQMLDQLDIIFTISPIESQEARDRSMKRLLWNMEREGYKK